MATRVFDGIKFCEQSLKRTSQGIFLPSLGKIGPAVWEMFKEIVDYVQRTLDHPKSPPGASCAQMSFKSTLLHNLNYLEKFSAGLMYVHSDERSVLGLC